MPIYEYSCSHCNVKFELLRSLAQSGEAALCPNCHGSAKLIFSSFNALSGGNGKMTAPVGQSNSCSTCSALNCATCGK
ncbi:MAG: zinc ribbon domain-containing protein [Dehalococcoidia bacterium]|nr:zinc ribbon domain-containing protein [Dehalococcoidia bacterium]